MLFTSYIMNIIKLYLRSKDLKIQAPLTMKARGTMVIYPFLLDVRRRYIGNRFTFFTTAWQWYRLSFRSESRLFDSAAPHRWWPWVMHRSGSKWEEKREEAKRRNRNTGCSERFINASFTHDTSVVSTSATCKCAMNKERYCRSRVAYAILARCNTESKKNRWNHSIARLQPTFVCQSARRSF